MQWPTTLFEVTGRKVARFSHLKLPMIVVFTPALEQTMAESYSIFSCGKSLKKKKVLNFIIKQAQLIFLYNLATSLTRFQMVFE